MTDPTLDLIVALKALLEQWRKEAYAMRVASDQWDAISKAKLIESADTCEANAVELEDLLSAHAATSEPAPDHCENCRATDRPLTTLHLCQACWPSAPAETAATAAQETIQLSERDQAMFIDALLDPPEPNAALRKAMALHNPSRVVDWDQLREALNGAMVAESILQAIQVGELSPIPEWEWTKFFVKRAHHAHLGLRLIGQEE